jgi:hypothetical protein
MKNFLIIVIFLLALSGEIMCIGKAFTCDWRPIGKAEVAYTIAAVTGFGAVVGWFDIEDK